MGFCREAAFRISLHSIRATLAAGFVPVENGPEQSLTLKSGDRRM